MNWQELPEIYTWLMQFVNYEKNTDEVEFSLDNMRILTKYFGHPEDSHRKIHVAGSKGKGSTSSFIANLLQTAGYQVGIYSSPHVQYFTERFSTPDGPFSHEIYQAAANEIKTGIEALIATHQINPRTLTWYDVVTTFGMLVFRQAKVDFVVYEIGMGGRLDSTNIITPEISVITPIELEHTAILGKTHAKIAREKAGIIKPHIPIITAHQVPSAKKAIQIIARENNSNFTYLPDVSQISKIKYQISKQSLLMKFHLQLCGDIYDLSSRFVGKVQAENAALAILAARQIINITPEQIAEGIQHASLPGRFEFIPGGQIGHPEIPYIIIDGAHTKSSIVASMEILGQVPESKRALALFGTPKGKNIPAMTAEIAKKYQNVVITKPGDFKVSDLDEIANSFKQQGVKVEAISDFSQAIPEMIKRASDTKRPLIVIGSLHLAGEVKKILTKTCS